MADLIETLPGIWCWEARHQDWEAGDVWAPEVRAWAIRTEVGIVLVDPLVRDDIEGDAAWAGLDALHAAHGPIHAVLRSLHWHHRSCSQASARYDVPIYARPLPRDSIPVHPFDVPTMDGHDLLGGLRSHHLARDDELALWIPWASALLIGDVVLRREGRPELCPESWLTQPEDTWPTLRGQLHRLARDLVPAHLLLAHGPHELGDGRELAAAVGRARARPLPPFITVDDLAERREHPRLVDVRFAPAGDGAQRYRAAHLPGAVYLELEDVLSEPGGDPARGGRHPLPRPERFAAGLSAAGISDGDTVVAYDDAGGVIAARLVWLLRILGEDAAVLAPVPGDWTDEPTRALRPGAFSPRAWPDERFVDLAAVSTRGPDVTLLDARDPGRFAGAGADPLDPRPGHIPGAVNLPARANLAEDGRLLPDRVLRERLTAAGITPDRPDWISSCGSGVTACHTLLVAEAVGWPAGRLYPGSFSEWSRDPQRPVVSADTADG
ncbi:MAG TPA: sulfurtransferase [Solirubrobacteraceae bacterium]|nr:sulfurtransferase [Solirubrobacteraceae bacterium]